MHLFAFCVAWIDGCDCVTGQDVKFRSTVGARIAARSYLLWNRDATTAEWEQFLEEVVYKKPVTNLHKNVPTAPISNTGEPYPLYQSLQ